MPKVVGIIGGMGPLATVDLMKKVISYTPATKDQDHIHIIADSFSQIPDRTTAILGKGVDPCPYMIESAQRLEKAGADFLVIACNTAHFFFEAVKKSVCIPILHMPVETAKYLQENHFKKVGLLATDGTVNTKLYQHSCQNFDIEVMKPDKVIQKEVMEGIYAIKGGKLAKGFLSLSTVANKLIEEGAEAIIAGCTEVPLVLKSSNEMVIVDPTEILAKTIIETANETSNRIQLV
jgi:aspartate racemase